MGKVAKLVVTTFITRVVMDENTSLEEIAELVKPKLLDKINNNEVAENIETILPDEECPYTPACPICHSENTRPDLDFSETMVCCKWCGCDFTVDGEVILDPTNL